MACPVRTHPTPALHGEARGSIQEGTPPGVRGTRYGKQVMRSGARRGRSEGATAGVADNDEIHPTVAMIYGYFRQFRPTRVPAHDLSPPRRRSSRPEISYRWIDGEKGH